MTLLPTPWPADPVEGEPGHFEHTLWVKAGLIALDQGKISKPGGTVPAGRILATTAENTWGAVPPTSVGVVPSGAIIAYHGSGVPSGWALCDGTNGTPDLRGRFIVGASTSRAPGSTGGQEYVTLSDQQSGIRAHVHTTDQANAAHAHGLTETNLSHNHGMDHAGLHSHDGKWIPYVNSVGVAGSGKWATRGDNGHDYIPPDGNHAHGIHYALGNHGHTVQTGNATHGHDVNPNTSANAVQPHNNMPPYYALVYIMKL